MLIEISKLPFPNLTVMKKIFFLLITFAIVLSCSSDENSTPPPAPIVKYTITLSAGEGGTVSTTGGEYEAGQTVSVTATPQGEYVFTGWSDGITDATRTITIDTTKTITANFEKKKYPLTVNIEGEGEVLEEIVNAGRTTDYNSGATIKLTAQPEEGWLFTGWSGDIGDIDPTENPIQLSIIESKTVTVTFENLELTEALINFYNNNGGKDAFSELQTLALESLIIGFKNLQEGNLYAAKLRVDKVFSTIDYSELAWMENTNSFSHCKSCNLNIGSPIAYYGLRMLDNIISLGNPKKNGELNMTVVIALCASVSRPTIPNLEEEIVNLNISPKILENDSRLLKISTDLFRNWVKAITNGLEVNLKIVELEDCTTVSYNYDGTNVISYPDTYGMINSVSKSISEETDFWWVIAPSGVPGDGSDFDIQGDFITGGMGLYGAGLPVFISDDAWFTRKPEHMGVGNYSEIEIRAYMPQWFQHEFMHHLYRKWNNFELEKTGHQWFDRSTWPSDFIGTYEPDYYSESITKRLLNAIPTLSEGLKAPRKINLTSNQSIILGEYRREPVENLWHEVNISLNSSGQFFWNNAAGVSWSLKIIDGALFSGEDCPYGVQQIDVIGYNNIMTEIYFNGESYKKVIK
jgi:hypothetical protein